MCMNTSHRDAPYITRVTSSTLYYILSELYVSRLLQCAAIEVVGVGYGKQPCVAPCQGHSYKG
jgi:hypothetical protein